MKSHILFSLIFLTTATIEASEDTSGGVFFHGGRSIAFNRIDGKGRYSNLEECPPATPFAPKPDGTYFILIREGVVMHRKIYEPPPAKPFLELQRVLDKVGVENYNSTQLVLSPDGNFLAFQYSAKKKLSRQAVVAMSARCLSLIKLNGGPKGDTPQEVMRFPSEPGVASFWPATSGFQKEKYLPTPEFFAFSHPKSWEKGNCFFAVVMGFAGGGRGFKGITILDLDIEKLKKSTNPGIYEAVIQPALEKCTGIAYLPDENCSPVIHSSPKIYKINGEDIKNLMRRSRKTGVRLNPNTGAVVSGRAENNVFTPKLLQMPMEVYGRCLYFINMETAISKEELGNTMYLTTPSGKYPLGDAPRWSPIFYSPSTPGEINAAIARKAGPLIR